MLYAGRVVRIHEKANFRLGVEHALPNHPSLSVIHVIVDQTNIFHFSGHAFNQMNGPVRRSIGNNDNFVIDFFIDQVGID